MTPFFSPRNSATFMFSQLWRIVTAFSSLFWVNETNHLKRETGKKWGSQIQRCNYRLISCKKKYNIKYCPFPGIWANLLTGNMCLLKVQTYFLLSWSTMFNINKAQMFTEYLQCARDWWYMNEQQKIDKRQISLLWWRFNSSKGERE